MLDGLRKHYELMRGSIFIFGAADDRFSLGLFPSLIDFGFIDAGRPHALCLTEVSWGLRLGRRLAPVVAHFTALW